MNKQLSKKLQLRCPHTIEEAFGQGASKHIDEDVKTGYSPLWWFLMLLLAIASAFAIFRQDAEVTDREKCIAKHGEGVAIKYDQDGNFVSCGPRRKS